MPPTSLKHSTILLITALVLIQGAAALTIEQAPLNPEFVAYMEEQVADDSQYSIACCGDSCPDTDTSRMPYATGYLPAPAVTVWPDTYAADVYGTAGITGTAFPSLFDLSDDNRVTPVRDQGWCGSCWAFATIGSLESTYLTDTGTAENFSENNMKNLCSNLYPDGFDLGPCDGGNAQMSAAYLTRGSGPVQETGDPYLLPMPSTISSTNLTPVLDVNEITFLPPRTGPLDNSLYKQTLMDEGAFQIWFQINGSCFADNATTYYLPDGDYPIAGNHIVTLVGWDDDFPKEDFAVTPPDDGAFILKNSWGTSSGDDGYFYISYYDVSLDYAVLFTGVPADAERQIYQYDPLGWNSNFGTGTSTTYYGANIFTAENYEALTDVSFYTIEPDTDYTVAIFTNFTTPPGDVAPVAWTSGTSALPGYHTISLPDSVTLMPGEVFSVVLEITSPTSVYPLAVELPIPGYSSKATAGAGESYVSDDGSTWVDLTTIYPDTNACIKAFTHPLTVVPRDYPTIQGAVDAAASGDTIIVEAGTYSEELVLNKSLTLFGVGMPVLATPADGTGVEIKADNITITGFIFDGDEVADYGVKIERNDATVSDIEITGYEDGLYIGHVKRLSLSTTAIHDNDNNLIFEDPQKAPGNSIADTVTVNGHPVIYREGVTGETIDASSNAGTIICLNCTDVLIRDTSTAAVTNGYYLFGCRNVTMVNVTADAADSGVVAYESVNITVRDSSFGPDVYYGICLMGITGALVENNDIVCRDEGIGISTLETWDTTLKDNTIINGMGGIFGGFLINSSITGNTIDEHVPMGIGVMWGFNLAVTNNTADAPLIGILTRNVANSVISDNTLRCNDTGTGIMIGGVGMDVIGNTVENSSIQARMILKDANVCGNSFTGREYAIIKVSGEEEDVYVYRNDFVKTNLSLMRVFSTSAVTESMPSAAGMDVNDIIHAVGLPDENRMLNEPGQMAIASDMTDSIGINALPPQVGETKSVTWHSPENETYWYNGRAFTRTMGNYWSTYNGTDTTHDGIGDTPFVISETENDTFPLVKPSNWYLDEQPDSGSEDPSADMATSHALNAGDSATLTFTGSAVQSVTITAAEGTGRILLTVDPARTGPDGLAGPVYQYLSAQLSGMTDDEISEAEFSFRIPNAWMNAEGLLPADITLWRFHNGVWQELPTSIISDEGGWIHFTATTPGFSTFAIATGDGQKVAVTTEPTVSIEDTGTDTAEENVSVVSEPSVTVAIPEEEPTANPTEDTTTPQESPLGFITIIGGAVGAALFFRKWE